MWLLQAERIGMRRQAEKARYLQTKLQGKAVGNWLSLMSWAPSWWLRESTWVSTGDEPHLSITDSGVAKTLDYNLYHLLPKTWGLPWWLNGKESACQCRRCTFNPWVGKLPWRRKWQSTPVYLPGNSHGQRSLACCSPQGRKELHTTWWLNNTIPTHFLLSLVSEWEAHAPSSPLWTAPSRLSNVCTLV